MRATSRARACRRAARPAPVRRAPSCAFASLSPPRALLSSAVDAPLEAVEVGQHQLGLDDLGVAQRIDAALDVGHVGIVEAAQHVDDGVDLADVAEELVAEPFARGGAAHQAGDVDELELRRDDLRRLGDARRALQPLVRHGDAADVRLDGAERDSWPPAPPRVAVSALNSVDLPTFGRPTMPQLKPMDVPLHLKNSKLGSSLNGLTMVMSATVISCCMSSLKTIHSAPKMPKQAACSPTTKIRIGPECAKPVG